MYNLLKTKYQLKTHILIKSVIILQFMAIIEMVTKNLSIKIFPNDNKMKFNLSFFVI